MRLKGLWTACTTFCLLCSACLMGGVESSAAAGEGRFAQEVAVHRDRQQGLPSADIRSIALVDGRVIARTARGSAEWSGTEWRPGTVAEIALPTSLPPETRGVSEDSEGTVAAATAEGLYRRADNGDWERVAVDDGLGRRWAVADVRAVTHDKRGRLWFATPAGIGVQSGTGWRLYPAEELPWNDFTCAAGAPDGSVWFGTSGGAIRFDGSRWSYRQGLRWLPSDEVRGLVVTDDNVVWLATADGVGCIESRMMSLSEKAAYYEGVIEERVSRTPYGYVSRSRLSSPGDVESATPVDDDNDGLWTAMYGAAQCFAYAVDRSPENGARARRAFEALRFLQDVTQGGAHSPPMGFVARSILPSSGPDPNAGSEERDRQMREQRDRMWKEIAPRWPLSADGEWWWKCDTSSDELDGHYFFYAVYYDLVASDLGDEAEVQAVVRRLTDHLIAHDYALVDHDDKPTRWAVFGPDALNHDARWSAERGLNSMSLLSYLAVAEHVTGDKEYGDAARRLREEHAYDANTMNPKVQRGVGSGNQSDDEMAFMSFYNLIRYTGDAELRRRYAAAFHSYWRLEAPERNPLFDYLYAAVGDGVELQTAFGPADLSPFGAWREESLDTLRRMPLDRVNWPHRNGHRLDVRPLPVAATRDLFERPAAGLLSRGACVDGSPVPIDERSFDHWNHDPWQLDTGGDGRTLAPGTAFLLPYHLGRYHGYIP